jgi:short-subunit dehydrogenase
MLDLNAKATIIMTQKLLGITSDIISTAGLRGKPNEAAYCATKFAVRGFTESLAKN